MGRDENPQFQVNKSKTPSPQPPALHASPNLTAEPHPCSPFCLAHPPLTVLAEEVVDVLTVLPQEVEGLRVVQVHRLRHVNDVQLALLIKSTQYDHDYVQCIHRTDEDTSWQTDRDGEAAENKVPRRCNTVPYRNTEPLTRLRPPQT